MRRINKGFIQILLIIGILVAMTLQVSAAGYYASGNNPYYPTDFTAPCYDIEGSTTPVLINGVANSGLINFDLLGTQLSSQYAACVQMDNGNKSIAKPVLLKGWAWDNNLGWISLYCGDEDGNSVTPNTNLGIKCGKYAYRVNIVTNGSGPDYASVKMNGYAWGDNIGWIQFNNSYDQLSPTSSGTNRGLVEQKNASNRNYVWADSVGWFNFVGVRFPWTNTTMLSDKVIVCSSVDWDSATQTCTNHNLAIGEFASKIPLAASSQSWIIDIIPFDNGVKVPFSEIDFSCTGLSKGLNVNTTSVNGKIYKLCAQLSWADSVNIDQTTLASQGASSNLFDTNNSGAVTKPLQLTQNFNGNGYGGKVTSLAPTSDQNIYIPESFANEKFYYPKTVSGYDGTKINQNMLKLANFQVMFFKYKSGTTAGKCIYGNLNKITGLCTLHRYGGGELSFKSPVNVNTLNQKIGNGTKTQNYLSLSYGGVGSMNYSAAQDSASAVTSSNIEFFTGLGSSTSPYILNFVDKTLKVMTSPINGVLTKSGSLLVELGAKNKNNPPSSGPSNAEPYIYSMISYNVVSSPSKTVKYFSAKLPRIKAGILKNPVASVTGNVYATGISKKASNIDIKSLGNISSNLKREQILRNISKYTAGKQSSTLKSGATTVNLNSIGEIPLFSTATSDIYYINHGDLTIDCKPLICQPTKNVTFVVNDGSIFIKSNIEPKDGVQVGLIALKDLDSQNYSWGNLYVISNVTDIWNTQIYLDRLIMSCDQSCTITNGSDKNAGWPVFVDDYDRQDKLDNQLAFSGTISSLNGFGNATAVTKLNEFGAVILNTALSSYPTSSSNGQAPMGVDRAKTSDLNFLRYYGPGLQTCMAGNVGSKGVSGVPMDQQLIGTGNECNPSFPSYSIDATRLVVNGGDLIPGGAAGQKSDYGMVLAQNNSSGLMASEYPVYFEYSPISRNLLGFETSTSFNPMETP